MDSSAGQWSHFNPVEIQAGRGMFERLGAFLDEGQWLLVTTRGAVQRGWVDAVARQAPAGGLLVHDGVASNPELDELDRLTQAYRGKSVHGIVALGGGSVLDTAKVLSVTLPDCAERPLDRVFRRAEPQAWRSGLPVVAVPTTSGTGAEVTPFATVWDKARHKKYSVAGSQLYPRVAVLDPVLTLTLPPRETLYTALDAASHALESLWNRNRTVISESYAWRSVQLLADYLPVVVRDPACLDAREALQQASLLSGLAICRTRTAIAHGISYSVTTHYGVPHGLACSFTLPSLIRVDLPRHGPANRLLLEKLLSVLDGLRLDDEIRRYIGDADLTRLRDEMMFSGRTENYIHEVDLDRILSESTRGAHGGKA